MILTVPYVIDGVTQEHFTDLYQYQIVHRRVQPILKNITRDGREQVYDDLRFHGGPGSNLEMRIFSRTSLLSELSAAGFLQPEIHAEPVFEYGIYWNTEESLPIVVRKR